MWFLPLTINVSQLEATLHMSPVSKLHPSVRRPFWRYRGRGQLSSPTHAETEFHQLNCKNKTLPISCLSFLPSGWKGISGVLLNTLVVSWVYLSWRRLAFDISAQGKVVFSSLAINESSSWICNVLLVLGLILISHIILTMSFSKRRNPIILTDKINNGTFSKYRPRFISVLRSLNTPTNYTYGIKVWCY